MIEIRAASAPHPVALHEEARTKLFLSRWSKTLEILGR
jgi:hypothetical protein